MSDSLPHCKCTGDDWCCACGHCVYWSDLEEHNGKLHKFCCECSPEAIRQREIWEREHPNAPDGGDLYEEEHEAKEG